MPNTKPGWTKQASDLIRQMDDAIDAGGMISEGDRIMVALSGGKDSLALLKLLNMRRRWSKVPYSLMAAHVTGSYHGEDISPPDSLVDWVHSGGVEFHTRRIYLAPDESLPMGCSRCSWNRRRTLFEMARDLGCNKVALGHNLDDLAGTALLNLFAHGTLETMPFSADYFSRVFSLVRPLALVREREIARFARAASLPVVDSQCPFAVDSARRVAKDILATVRRSFRHADRNTAKAARLWTEMMGIQARDKGGQEP